MSEIKSSFLGVPVTGDITVGSNRVEQKPIEELAPLFQALLDDPLIKKFGWRQYTPYFNDGEPCEFSVNDVWVLTTEDDEETENEYGYFEWDNYTVGASSYGDGHPTLGKRNGEYNRATQQYETLDYVGNHEETYDKAAALSDAIGSGAFDNVLLASFGDHAKISVTREGIEVEFYEHD